MGRAASPAHRFRLRAAVVGALAVGLVLAVGISAASAGSAHSGGANYEPGKYPGGCEGWDLCTTQAPLPNGMFMLTVTEFAGANEGPLVNFWLGSGNPVTILRPKGVCHSEGKVPVLLGEGYPLQYKTFCEVTIPEGHSMKFCESGLTPIKHPEHPTDPEWDAPPTLTSRGTNEIWSIGGLKKCTAKEISHRHKHPKH
jgi:hypothetical protein